MKRKKVYLTLQNGMVFQGYAFGADGDISGELVFSTGMVGYIETLTDPSNYGQMVVQTFPLIGNYGMMKTDVESDKAWVSAYIVREVCDNPSNFRMEGDLESYLKEQGIDVVYFPYGQGVSSTNLKARIYENYEKMKNKADNHFPLNTDVRN